MTEGRVAGLRASAVIAVPTAGIGVSFGVLAEPMIGGLAAVLMSMLVWSGAAQFAALTALSGGPVIASTTGLLANARYLAMGFAIAPSLNGAAWKRAGTGALLADASFVVAHRSGADFDLTALRWAWPVQYASWVGGTALGVLGAAVIDPEALGLDVLFGMFYLSMLLPEVRSRLAIVASIVAAATALMLTPVLPEGVPVLVASLVALLGLRSKEGSS